MKATAPEERISDPSAARRATREHLRQQAINSGVSNAVFNSLFFYLFHMDLGVITRESIISDTLVTCGFVAFLVTWPTSFFTRKAVAAGLPPMERISLVDRLPKKWPLLGLTLWLLSALVLEPLTWLGFVVCGISEISFLPMLAVKFVSMGLLGGALGALVAARYLQPGVVAIRQAE